MKHADRVTARGILAGDGWAPGTVYKAKKGDAVEFLVMGGKLSKPELYDEGKFAWIISDSSFRSGTEIYTALQEIVTKAACAVSSKIYDMSATEQEGTLIVPPSVHEEIVRMCRGEGKKPGDPK